MDRNKPELLVLDAHGVVLNSPFLAFLDYLGTATGQAPIDVRNRWRDELRTPTWTGELPERILWRRLSGTQRCWRDELEAMYEPGPAASRLSSWSRQVPIWLLSNHRSDWLIPRLERFGLSGFFERVIVSDQIGFAKPQLAAFDSILQHVRNPGATVFVDDRERNVAAAIELGMQAIHANPKDFWVAVVDDLVAPRITLARR